jgi:hypothetical protein
MTLLRRLSSSPYSVCGTVIRRIQMGKARNGKGHPKAPKCLTDSCQNESKTRGLCPNCHAVARRRIREEEATEQELVDLGLMLPSRQGMRETAFIAALEKRRQLAAAAGK